jgi:hypothetical protein
MSSLLEIYKVVNIKSTDFNIYKNTDGKMFFDLISFAMIHYRGPKYLINYYGHQKKYITIFYKSYTDWSGMIILCAKARKNGVFESFKILQKEIDCENLNINIKLVNTFENKIINEIKEYFGKRYEYIDQYEIKKDGIIVYKVDLIIKNNIGLDIAVEIDEEHHNTKNQKNKDKVRESEIKRLHNWYFIRIKHNLNNKNYLNDIEKLLINSL